MTSSDKNAQADRNSEALQHNLLGLNRIWGPWRAEEKGSSVDGSRPKRLMGVCDKIKDRVSSCLIVMLEQLQVCSPIILGCSLMHKRDGPRDEAKISL